jgi:hypothetical protein
MMKTKKNLFKLSTNRIQKQLGLSAAAIAGCALGHGDVASAAIVNTFQSANLSVPASLAGVYINLSSGATGSSAAAVAGWDFNPYQTSSGLGFYWSPDLVGADRGGGVVTVPAGTVYADLAVGAVVGPASPFSSSIQGANPNFRTTGVHYLGFRFSNAGALNYGYAAIQTTAGSGNLNGFPATVLGWRFDDAANTPITIAPIPEPGSAGLLATLAAGATALRALRRRTA